MVTVLLELCHHLRDDDQGRITASDALAQSMQENATTSLGEILRLLGPQLERVRLVTQCLQTLSDHAHGVSSTYRQSPSPAVRVSLSKTKAFRKDFGEGKGSEK